MLVLNPVKSFGFIPKLLKFVLFDFVDVFELSCLLVSCLLSLDVLDDELLETFIVPAVAPVNGELVDVSAISAAVAVTLTFPSPFIFTVTLAEPSTNILLCDKLAFPDTLKFTFPATPFPDTVAVTVSPTLACELEKLIVKFAAIAFGAIAIISTIADIIQNILFLKFILLLLLFFYY